MIAIAQYFHYEIVETMPLEKLEDFKDHRRLRVFYHKGCKCVQCGIEGTQLAVGIGRGGKHVDVYTDDFYPLTVDHRIPKSLGGPDDLENLQPMCCLCNWSKGNGIRSANHPNRTKYPSEQVISLKISKSTLTRCTNDSQLNIGLEVWVYAGNKKYKYLGIISNICINPVTKISSVQVEGKPDSYYHTNRIYYKK